MKDEILKVIEVLKNGGIILYPTDTIWGIGCDPTNAEAVDRIYKLKNRSDSKSMIILVDHVNKIYDYVKEVPDAALQLIEVNDQPMTIIYPDAENLVGNLINADKTIAIRVTDDEFCKQLIYRFRKAIVSTSANISGKSHPAKFDDIDQVILDGVDYVVNWRRNEVNNSKPSSIIKVGLGGEIEIIRT